MADFEILSAEEIAELQKWDTPSVCNALEIFARNAAPAVTRSKT